jgi:hypothetical protein
MLTQTLGAHEVSPRRTAAPFPPDIEHAIFGSSSQPKYLSSGPGGHSTIESGQHASVCKSESGSVDSSTGCSTGSGGGRQGVNVRFGALLRQRSASAELPARPARGLPVHTLSEGGQQQATRAGNLFPFSHNVRGRAGNLFPFSNTKRKSHSNEDAVPDSSSQVGSCGEEFALFDLGHYAVHSDGIKHLDYEGSCVYNAFAGSARTIHL